MFGQPTTTFGFGAPQTNTAPPAFSFNTGQSNSTGGANIGFGTQQPQSSAPSFGFGTQQSTTAAPAFGGFGSNQTSTPAFGFGATPNSSAPSTFGFTSVAPAVSSTNTLFSGTGKVTFILYVKPKEAICLILFLSKDLEHLEHLKGVRRQPGVLQDLDKEPPLLELLARPLLSQSLQYPYNSLVRQLRLSSHLFSTATYMAMSVMPFSPDGISFKPLGEQEKVGIATK